MEYRFLESVILRHNCVSHLLVLDAESLYLVIRDEQRLGGFRGDFLIYYNLAEPASIIRSLLLNTFKKERNINAKDNDP